MKLRSGSRLTTLARQYRKASMLHSKARKQFYPNSEQKRLKVRDDQVLWKVDWKEYNPPEYTAPVVKKGPVWADPDINKNNPQKINFNQKDGLVNRISFTGMYELIDNIPRNPKGRTGLRGRGLLGKWGPNHAADPVATRWRRNQDGEIEKDNDSNLPILQFIAIKRKDSGEWAIPGGMVDAGETVSFTLKREFGEETLNTLKYTEDEKKAIEKEIAKLFTAGVELYSGYVDDPRNTDNAWMETVVMNFHDENGTSVSKLALEAGDDAGGVRWMNVSSALNLYADHSAFLQKAAELHKAHW